MQLQTTTVTRRTRRMVHDRNSTIPTKAPSSEPESDKTNPLAVEVPPAASVPKEMALTEAPKPDSNSYSDWALSQILAGVKRTERLHADLLDPDGDFSTLMKQHNADAALKLAAAAQKFETAHAELSGTCAGLSTDMKATRDDIAQLTPRVKQLETRLESLQTEVNKLRAELDTLKAKEGK